MFITKCSFVTHLLALSDAENEKKKVIKNLFQVCNGSEKLNLLDEVTGGGNSIFFCIMKI